MSIVLTQPPKQNSSAAEWEQWYHRLWLFVSDNSASGLSAQLLSHIANVNNPHATSWAQVTAANSTLSTIINRSHSQLQDVGVNSHATIDAHLSTAANPHGTTLQQAYDAGEEIELGSTDLSVLLSGVTKWQVTAGGDVFVYGRDPMRYALMGS